MPTLYFGNKTRRLLEEPAGYLRAFWCPGEREPLVLRVGSNYCPLYRRGPGLAAGAGVGRVRRRN